METRLLQYFLAVAREQNFSRAAESLHTSQPNLSKQLSDLESQLGKQLFVRGSRHVTLTEEGLLLQQRAQQILSLIQQTETDVQNLRQTISGSIHLGIIIPSHIQAISSHLAAVHTQHPGITFDLHTQSSTECFSLLDRGTIDFALILQPSDDSGYNSLSLPYSEAIGLCMSPSSPLADRTSITPEDLTDQPFLLTKQNLEDPVLETWLGQPLSTLSCITTSDSPSTISLLASEGLGISFAPEMSTLDSARNTVWRPLNPPLQRNLSLIWSKRHPMSKPAEQLLFQLQNVVE